MLTLKVLPVFPSNVRGSSVVTVEKANGIWTIGFDMSVLDTPVITDLSIVEVLIRNRLTGAYGRVHLLDVLASGAYASPVTGGTYNVSATETYLRCELTSAVAINLPASATREGLDLDIKDSLGNFETYNATLTPAAGEDIDGMPDLVMSTDYMFVKLRPKTNGWEIINRG